jgi:hypothetical protein
MEPGEGMSRSAGAVSAMWNGVGAGAASGGGAKPICGGGNGDVTITAGEAVMTGVVATAGWNDGASCGITTGAGCGAGSKVGCCG